MLSDIGVDSYYVLINSRRGAVTPEFVSPLVFDHAILAMRPPAGMPTEGVQSKTQHPQLGELILFDPTDPYVKLGDLPRGSSGELRIGGERRRRRVDQNTSDGVTAQRR
jgi:hypothetical protein